MRRVAVAAAALLCLAGCGGADEASRSADDGLGLEATSSYGRHAAVRGKVDVRIANSGQADVQVRTWQVRHPLFEQVPPYERPSTVPADGAARIVPVPFGAPRCDRSEAGDGVVVLGVVRDGVQRDVEVPLVDGEPGLARAHRLTCAARAVTEAVALDVGVPAERSVVDGRPVLRTVLSLARRGAGTVEVTDVGGGILFTVESAPPARLAVGDDTAALPLLVRASRCEAHALTESKTSFTFPVFVRLDGGEPVLVQVRASPAGERALAGLLTDTCGPELLGG